MMNARTAIIILNWSSREQTWPESETICLLSARRFLSLFPGSEVLKVRITFWPETLTVFHRGLREQCMKPAASEGLAMAASGS